MSALCSHCGEQLTPLTTFVVESEGVSIEVLVCGNCDKAMSVAGQQRDPCQRSEVDEIVDLFDAAVHIGNEGRARTLRSEAMGALESHLSKMSGGEMALFERLFTELVERHRQRRS